MKIILKTIFWLLEKGIKIDEWVKK